MITKYKKGHRVWAFNRGWGDVTHVFEEAEYPVHVKWDSGEVGSFTFEGNEFAGETPVLMFREVAIPADAWEPPIEHMTLKIGDVVLLKNRTFAWVAEHSDHTSNSFAYHLKVPNFDEAFGFLVAIKTDIEKKIGTTNVE